jgi:DNA-binding transcriptional ArsR family regulator
MAGCYWKALILNGGTQDEFSPGKGGVMKVRTIYLVADLLMHAPEPRSIRQIATQIRRPVRSVSNVVLRLRRAELVEVAEVIKPLGTRRVALYRWNARLKVRGF